MATQGDTSPKEMDMITRLILKLMILPLRIARLLFNGHYGTTLTGIENRVHIIYRHHLGCAQAHRLVQREQSIKLELGGGPNTRPGWTNLDLFAPNADLTLDLRRPLPFPDGCVDAIYSEHLLEHFSYPDPLSGLLRECFRVLKVGGTFSAAVPDARRAFAAYTLGPAEFWRRKYWSSPEPNWCKCPMDELNWLIYMGEFISLCLMRRIL